jgi:hypothetical protein
VEQSDLNCRPPYRVSTFRDGQQVISEDVETEVAAKVRFASAVDLCRSRDDAHSHRVELRSGDDVLDTWPGDDA